MEDLTRMTVQNVTAIAVVDRWADAIERGTVGRVRADAVLLLGRLIFGLPLLMNGVGQIAMPGLMESQMNMVGVSLVWKWPAILASLTGGVSIVLGWRVRLAAALLIVYVVAATLLFHNTHTLVTSGDPLAVPDLALGMCKWYVYDFKGVSAPVSDEFLHGCAVYRMWFDGAKTMDHLTMMVPALLLLIVTGGGRYSVESYLSKKWKA